MIKSIYRFLSPKFQTLFSEYKVNLAPRYNQKEKPHRELYNIINENRGIYSTHLNSFLNYKKPILEIKKQNKKNLNESNPTWNNGFLPGLDIIALYGMIAHYKPNKYIEIGSGNSTKVAYKSIKENKTNTEIISIDPYPRSEINHLSDKVIRDGIENIDHNEILNLEENDILFIDNSHRILPNSDAMVVFMEIFHKLKKGVIVHIHDIYLPYDYPQFMCDRFYSEQYGLAFFLLANSRKYKPILPNYFIYMDKTLHNILNPFWEDESLKDVEQHGGSFWLKIS